VTGVQTCALPISPEGAPSKRIAKRIPFYKKYKAGGQGGVVNVLKIITLPNLRKASPHFDAWVEKLEMLGKRK
jgi:hypothetical protein